MSHLRACIRPLACVGAVLLAGAMGPSAALAAISFDGSAGTGWWFDPANWSTHGVGAVPPYFVPPTSDGFQATDTNINNGWDFASGGVVYDPANDPSYAALTDADYDYPTEVDSRFDRNTIWRFYITTGAATVDNKFTMKSGTLEIISHPSSSGYVLLGRGGSVPGLKGVIVQTGGSFLVRDDNIDIGNYNTSAGNGVYEYFGGTLEAGLDTATNKGIRLAAGGSAGSAASGYFGVHNGGEVGHIRAYNFTVGAHLDATFGTTSSVSTVEFFANNEGTRPIQVVNNLSINHQDDSQVSGSTRSAVLQLSLDEAPALGGNGVPINLGLFDVQGLISGQSGVFYDDSIANGGTPYKEGDLVSAEYQGSTYNWTISYTGDIAWSDYDDSVVSSVTGAGTGGDIVLIGHSSTVVGVAGDFDGDNDVDGVDFLVWQRGSSPDPLSSGDLNAWKSGFGTAASGMTAAAIPEPATGVLAMLVAGAVMVTGKRRGDGR